MQLTFHKYQGAGNDFILCDDRAGGTLTQQLSRERIARLCHRNFGIGADGLMLLRDHAEYDFEMVYYNSDGALSSMCGNGGRCITRFAADLGMERETYRFLAIDGEHHAAIRADGQVALGMQPVSNVLLRDDGDYTLDTGSPHYLRFLDTLEGLDVNADGRLVRNAPEFRRRGINVNFVVDNGAHLEIATYERGVEHETLACGTGVTAAAIGAVIRRGFELPLSFRIPVRARGGALEVSGETDGRGKFWDLSLIGPAEFVFRGTIAPVP